MLPISQAHRFGLAICGGVGVLLALVGSLNLIVDPYLLYHTGIFEPLIQSNREDKYQLLLERPVPPDLVILGSSRAERLRPARAAALSGLSAFNASVSRATPVDFLVWTRFLLEGIGHRPHLLIVSVDVEAFNPMQQWMPSTWLDRSPFAPYAEGASLQDSGATLEDSLRMLFSWQQTSDALTVLWGDLSHSRPPRTWFYDADGAYTLPDAELPADSIPDPSYLISFYTNYPALSEAALTRLAEFLDLCQQAGITVILYIPPYREDLLATLRTQTAFQARHNELAAAIVQLTETYSGDFYDLLDASSFNGLPDAFLNGDHMDTANSDLLLAYLLAAFQAEHGLQ